MDADRWLRIRKRQRAEEQRVDDAKESAWEASSASGWNSLPYSSSLNTLIFTSCAIVRSLNPRALMRSTNGASILKTLI
jgi:hypothetical protein